MKKRTRRTFSNRYHILDEARGFAVVCMVFYHAFVTIEMLGFRIGTTLYNFFEPAEPFFAMFFILLSGICCQLSRSNLKRGLKLAAVAAALSLITIYLDENFIDGIAIKFGILHLLAAGMLLIALINPLLQKIPPLLTAAVSLILFVFTYSVQDGHMGFGAITVNLPPELYSSDWLFFLGFPNFFTFSSADYFPILPWIFMFICGAAVGLFEKRGKFPDFFKKERIRPFGVVGRNALPVYILHQPLIYGMAYVVKFFVDLAKG